LADRRFDVTFAEFLSKGGPVMYVILALSILALAIVLLKSAQFAGLRLTPMRFVEEALLSLGAGDSVRAEEFLDRDHPVARVMRATLTAALDARLNGQAVRTEVERVGSAELRALESWLRGLSAIGHLCPLLGLFGTVMGMIAAFMTIEHAAAAVNPAQLAGGIWEALLTTAFGLMVAIPAMAAFYLFEGEVDRIRAMMKDGTVRVLVRCGKNAEGDILKSSAVGEDYGV
jgi:biopolymer transport protein ExbB